MNKTQTESNYFTKHIKTTNPLILSIINQSLKTQPLKSQQKIKDILITIIKKDKEKLKSISYEGLPDDLPILRSLIWKINLNYLTLEVDKWQDYLTKKRSEYEDYKTAFQLKIEVERKLFQDMLSLNEQNDTTYNQNEINDLKTYLEYTDKNLLEAINKDIKRTHTDLNFFFLPSSKDEVKFFTSEQICDEIIRKRTTESQNIYIRHSIFETHADVLSRILYIYAKLNPEVDYIQGMNEVLAPIYFCYSIDDSEFLEADTFWSFSFLMDDLRMIFMRNKDKSKDGIFQKLNFLDAIIKFVDKDIHKQLINNGVEFSHFAFRWVILFFSQDFILPDVLRLWDSIMSEKKDRFYLIYYISIAILLYKKKAIMTGDFAGIITALQDISDIDIQSLFDIVNQIRSKYDKKIKKLIYAK